MLSYILRHCDWTLSTLKGNDRSIALFSPFSYDVRPSARQSVLFFFFVRITIELSQKNSWLELFVRFLDFLFFVSIHSSIHAPVACWAHFVQTLFRLTAAVEGRKRAGPFVQDGRPADSWPRRRHFPRYLRKKKRLKTNNLINVVSVDFKFGSVDFLLRRIAFPHLFIYFIWKDILYGFDYGYRYYYDFFALLFLFFFGCYCIAALVIDYFGSDLGFLFFFFFCIGSRWCHNPDWRFQLIWTYFLCVGGVCLLYRERTTELRESKLPASLERCPSGRRSQFEYGAF